MDQGFVLTNGSKASLSGTIDASDCKYFGLNINTASELKCIGDINIANIVSGNGLNLIESELRVSGNINIPSAYQSGIIIDKSSLFAHTLTATVLNLNYPSAIIYDSTVTLNDLTLSFTATSTSPSHQSTGILNIKRSKLITNNLSSTSSTIPGLVSELSEIIVKKFTHC